MPDFDALFSSNTERPIKYKDRSIIRLDKYLVNDGEKLKICIESTNSKCPQGLTIDITGSCEVKGKVYKKGKGIRMLFWADAELIDPKNIEITVFTKKGHVVIYNIWEQTNKYLVGTSANPIEKESKSVEYWHGSAAMIVEEIENGRRYFCNDGQPDENFDDIVFTVQRV